MTGKDIGFVAALVALAVFIWVRDLTWVSAAGDALPILAALPIFVWLGKPWRFQKDSPPRSIAAIALAAAGFVVGVVTELTIVLALSWTWLLWTWLRSRLSSDSLPAVRKLLVLPLLAFPWITLDGQWIGWCFRLSAAWAVAHLFALMGFGVVQNGTNLLVQGLPISVEAACSGLNTLQSMLIAGSMLAFIFLGQQRNFWWNLPGLIALAWIANTVRIITLVVASLTISPEFSQGMFHTWGAWLVLVLMFLLCSALFAMQRARPTPAATAA
ncbi:MAG: exosortase/archaeosortase family protein [Pedosphaera sp.]|nr:exosortase/archaeosortase family protein [Pedosphaera sp.]